MCIEKLSVFKIFFFLDVHNNDASIETLSVSHLFLFIWLSVSQSWNLLALDGSNWQRIDLFDFQRDIEVRKGEIVSKQ